MNLFVMGSDFSMRLLETKYVRFENDNDPFCGLSITTSDMTTTFTFDGLGLHRSHLRRIIAEINNTLDGKYSEEFHLQFEDPNVVGGECFSPISFIIHPGKTHEEDYWEFLYQSNGGYHNSGKTQYSMCLCTNDLKYFRDDLQSQINNFNWKEHGKIEYYEIHLPEHELETAYSAEELRSDLSSLLTGKTLRKIYVDLYGFIDSSQRTENSLDFSYMGGASLLVFEDLAVELCIHAEGMIRYHVFYDIDPGAFVKKTGFAPEETYSSNSYFFDIAPQLSLKYENSWVKEIEVIPTDTWPFSQSWFDEEKAEASGHLPNLIKLNMSNGVRVCFEGDSIEYYFMWLE
ncbi:MAG: hypothetical protein IKQ69_11010 [Oscillospiraceae bacterium]|nr:hypothetical protein [Oscillospiraceae bacterium]